jgi:hypothetical protein
MGECSDANGSCVRSSVRAVALVPRVLMTAYFATHADSVHEGISSVTHDVCPPLTCTASECKCVASGLSCHARPECQLTNSIMVLARSRIVPTPLFYTIA